MQIGDFLKNEGKKVIIADSVSVGNALIRRCNIEEGINSVDTTVLTPLKMAAELVLAYEAVNGNGRNPQVLSRDGAVYVFDEVISDPKYRPGFIDERCLTISTVSQIYQAVSIIRSFDKTEAYNTDDNVRIKDIRGLIKVFEDKLERENIYDMPRIFAKAAEILNEIKSDKSKMPLSFYLSWAERCVFGDLSVNKRKGIEEELISLFLEVCSVSPQKIEVLPYDDIERSKRSGKVRWNYFVSYGQHNEIRYVADEILKMVKNGEGSFDKINLFYTSVDYENYIAGIFDYAGIPYSFDDCYHASNTDFIQLLFKILDFAGSGYKFEDIENIVLSEVFTFRGICNDTQSINPNTGYRMTPGEKIGWGRGRFENYLADEDVKEAIKEAEAYAAICKEKREDEKNISTDEQERTKDLNQGFFAIFLRDLLDIFDETNPLYVTYDKLIKFAVKYSYKGSKEQNAERKVIIDKLREQIRTFKFVAESRCPGVSEKTEYIRNYLENLTFSKKTGTVSVGIHKLSGFKILERPINYFIGMGAKQFALNSTESAIISDDEMKLYLNGPNIPYAGDRNINRQEQFRMLLESLPEGMITLGYSNFDSVDLRECSPSVMFMELQGDEVLNTPIAYDPIDEGIKIDPEEYRKWIDRITENDEQKERKPVVTPDEEAQMSASQLQVLLECPLKYYYKCIRKLSVPIVRRLTGDQWLPAMDRGNLIHRICQHYMEQVMPPVGKLTEMLNETVFEKVFSEEIKKIESEVPWASDAIKAKEISECKQTAENFLIRLHKEWTNDETNGKKWWVLGCELDFEYEDDLIYDDDGSILESESESETKSAIPYKQYPYSIHFRKGQIDRLDGYVDSENCLNLRIIDYKTGGYDTKKEEIKNDIEIQHFVYAMAAFEYVRKLRDHSAVVNGKNIFDVYPSIKGVRIEAASYDFPFEEADSMRISVMNGPANENRNMEKYLKQKESDPFQWKVEFPDGVRKKLRLTEGYRQNDKIDRISANIEENLSENKDDGTLWICNTIFCDYKKICRMQCGVNKMRIESDE